MKFVDWYNKKSEMVRNIILLVMIALLGFLVTSIFFFMNNPGVPLGWLFGSAIEIIAYFTIAKGAAFMLDPNHLNRKRGLMAPLFMILRFALYAGGLVLAAFATYRWGSPSCSYLNVWAVFVSYLPLHVVLLFATFFRLKKEKVEKLEKEEKSVSGDGEEND